VPRRHAARNGRADGSAAGCDTGLISPLAKCVLAFRNRAVRKPPRRHAPPFTSASKRRSWPMGLQEDIIKLVKNEGFKVNEAIKDALDEFVDIVNEENEDMDEDLEDDEEEEEEEEA
jgi:hypothetical protein